MKIIRQSYIITLILKINDFVDRSENAINTTKKSYERDKNLLLSQHLSELSKIDSIYKQRCDILSDRSSKMIKESKDILDQINSMDARLSNIDKYYLRTKENKELLLANVKSQKYENSSDLFDSLEKIKGEFEIIFRKYSENQHSELVNSVSHLFSSSRKSDYEELIVLKNTVRSIVNEIEQTISVITNENLKAFFIENQKQRNSVVERQKRELSSFEMRYSQNLEILANNIYTELDSILPDEFVAYLNALIKNNKANIYDISTSSDKHHEILSMMFINYPVSYFVQSEVVAAVLREKCSLLLIDDVIQFPIIISYTDDPIWVVDCNKSNISIALEFAHSIMFNFLSSCPVGQLTYRIIDPENHGNSIFPFFDVKKKLPELFGNNIVISSEEITNEMKVLCNKIDDILQNKLSNQHENIFEYKEKNGDNTIYTDLLMIFDFPKGFDDHTFNELRYIIRNGRKCGIIPIIFYVSDNDAITTKDCQQTIQSIFAESIRIIPKNHFFSYRGLPLSFEKMPEKAEFFRFFSKYMSAYEHKNSCKYFEIYPLPNNIQYKKICARERISVPIGIDTISKETFFANFDDLNPFAFLMGGTGAGKSRLLQMLITGLIVNYHPDDVELWMADFMKTGFICFKKNLPPHIKYLLLDNSPLYCFSFIDKLTEEFNRRQKIFGKNNWDNIKDIPNDYFMPIIFCIIDEFDVMSNAIVNNNEYKVKLEQIVTKGRKFGFRIIFSTQSYTTGTPGLTSTAKETLPIRMAMYKPSTNEVELTLDIKNKNENEDKWVKNIRPRHVLYKQANKESNYSLNYIENFDFDNESIVRRDSWINFLNKTMKKNNEYDPNNDYIYIDKNHVIIDGISEEKYIDRKPYFASIRKEYLKGFAAQKSDILLFPGNPCAFEKSVPLILSEDEYQNVLLLCDYKNNKAFYLTEVISSIIRSALESELTTEVWSLPKDICISNQKTSNYWTKSRVITDISNISIRIHELRVSMTNNNIEPVGIVISNMPKIITHIKRSRIDNNMGSKRNSNTSFSINDLIQEEINPDPIAFMNNGFNNIQQTNNFDKNDILEDLLYLLQFGPESGIHFIIHAESFSSLNRSGINDETFPHIIAFKMDEGDTLTKIDSYAREARKIPDDPEGIFLYTDRQKITLFTTYSNSDLLE
ncbi:MAG: hypothetical protein IJI41_03150 [Anaerolineaceae bacterium]|nr:hypothetical protein [Anaerolineaceae bacterium]